MEGSEIRDLAATTGDELLLVLAALASPHRMRILAALREGRKYVSELAREIGMSRPLLRVHLSRLETAGLVIGSLEVSETGKAMKYFEVVSFTLHLDQNGLAEAVRTLTAKAERVNGEESG